MQKKRVTQTKRHVLRNRNLLRKLAGFLVCVMLVCSVDVTSVFADMEVKVPVCGKEEHTHAADCYRHTHVQECYATEQGELICQETEAESHEHGGTCYIVERELICVKEENAGHVHDENCSDESGTLICTTPETESHMHEEACYEEKQTLNCEITVAGGHQHSDSCYAWNESVICGQEESQKQEIIVTNKELTCTQQTELHTHADGCYTDGQLSCGKEEHIHDDTCYEEKVGEETAPDADEDVKVGEETAPDADEDVKVGEETAPDADEVVKVGETAEEWEKTFADVVLTGDPAADLLAIANTQLNYMESDVNVITDENGKTKGYTRYGAWHGEEYAYTDWNSMFVAFCLHYTGVNTEEFPVSTDCVQWVSLLTEKNLFAENAGDYEPQAGDLVFFDHDSDKAADHVGILVEVIAAEGEDPAQIKVIKGDVNNSVQCMTYSMNDEKILGYGITNVSEEALTDEEQAEVDEVIKMIEEMPSADEIDAKLQEFEDAGDMDGYEAYYKEVYELVREVNEAFSALSEKQKAAVTNADKLLELEYIWSAEILLDEINFTAPTTVKAVSTREFVELNLYDYGSNINDMYDDNDEYPGFQWNGGAYISYKDDGTEYIYNRHSVDYIDFGNSMITDFDYASPGNANGKSTTSTDIVESDGSRGAINRIENDSYGVTNRPIGFSTGAEVVSRTLGSDGYPALADANKTSLSYLFKDGSYAKKRNTQSIDGLFQRDGESEEYYYNSRENHAQYSNNSFTLYNQIITPNFIVYPFGNFLPFNSITDRTKATQVGQITSIENYMSTIKNRLNESDSTENQLAHMLGRYLNDIDGNSIDDAKDAIKDYFTVDESIYDDNPSNNTDFLTTQHLNNMYNIDFNVDTNFFFGMEMKMNFMQPKGGMTGKGGTYPMEFNFTGDDDVWVYIDDVLFLDLSGIHRHVGGQIDFKEGKVYYYYLDTKGNGDVNTSKPYKTYTFRELLEAAGASAASLNENGTFKDYSRHTFNFYYMERGSGSSVCRIDFNFPLVKKNPIEVSKTVDTNNVDVLGSLDKEYKFQILKVENGEKVDESFIADGTSYRVYDANGNRIATRIMDSTGVFTLEAGQKAVFTGIAEDSGQYFVRELFDKDLGALSQYDITVDGVAYVKAENDVVINQATFSGADSPIKNIKEGATYFNFKNTINASGLGKLKISKTLNGYGERDNTGAVEFKANVTMNGTALPVGTAYMQTNSKGENTNKTVAENEAGIVVIPSGGSVTIPNIMAGTSYTVQEISESIKGNDVSYAVNCKKTNCEDCIYDAARQLVTGTIIAGTEPEIEVKITNNEKGVTVNLGGTKSMAKSDGTNRTFKLQLEEVDGNGVLKANGYTAEQEVEIGDAEDGFNFEFKYGYHEISSFPKYYRITEAEHAHANIMQNDTAYIVKVSLAYDEKDGGKVVPTVTVRKGKLQKDEDGNLKKDGNGKFITDTASLGTEYAYTTNCLTFTNIRTSSMKLQKTVVGGAGAKANAYTFTIEFSKGTSNVLTDVDRLPMECPITYDGTVTGNPQKVVLSANADKTELTGSVTVKLKHDESLTISNLPYGMKWKITEAQGSDYIVSNTVKVGTATACEGGADTGNSNEIAADKTSVVFTNTMLYRLPETGGTGTWHFTAAGLLLIFGSMAFMIFSRKRSRKERKETAL